MNSPATTPTGPPGSAVHVLCAGAGTVAEPAAIDWSRRFRRVRLDPVRGIITLRAPSRLHEDSSGIPDHMVSVAGSVVTGSTKGLRSTRLRVRGEPPGTGMEPDCAFHVGERARGCSVAPAEGEAAADARFERTVPDPVVEVEVTSADAGKVERHAEMEVRELWRLHGCRGTRELRAEFPALRPGKAPRELHASEVLDRFTPEGTCEAAEGVRSSLTHDERTEAVARIVRRRQRGGLRVREETPSYPAHSA